MRAFLVTAILPVILHAQTNTHVEPGGSNSTESGSTTTSEILLALLKKRSEVNAAKPDENFSDTVREQWLERKKSEAAVIEGAINNIRNGLSGGSEQIAKSVFNGTAEAQVNRSDNATLSVVQRTQTTTTTPESPDTSRAVTSENNSPSASTTTSQTQTEVSRSSVQDLTTSAKNEIERDSVFATAAVIYSLNKNKSSTTTPTGTTPAANNNDSYNDTYSSVSSASGGSSSGGGGSYSSYSPEMTALWSTMNQFNTNSYLNRATSYLGMQPGAYNLSSNPVYSTIKTTDNSDLLRQIALDSMRGKDDSTKLVDLATKDGFQDSLKTAIGEDAQDEFNLLTAGAAISSNGDFDPSVIMQAQSFINGVLNSQSIITDSPSLSSLNSALGGNGLALLSPETLNWLKYASDLAYADISTLPSKMQNRRDTYVQGYKDLENFLKNLALGDAVALLNTLKVPVDLDKNDKLYQEAHQNFIKAHNEPLKYLKSKELEGQDEARLLAFLERISKWVVQVPRHDVKALGKWSKLMGEDSQGTVLQWERVEPQSLTLARFFYAQMYYYASVASSFDANNKASDMIILVGDAQSWANFDLSQIKDRRLEKEKLEKSEKDRPRKKVKEKFIDG